MIISHKNKYLFIQIDQTASTAIAKELCENYVGKRILWKHARYSDFLKKATSKEKSYFKFAGVRNPLDVIVSLYFKYKNDHDERFSKKKKAVTKYNLKQFNFIKNNNADFPMFFKRFYYNDIYNEWKTQDLNKIDYIYRFENLQQEFSKILKMMNLKQKRPLPLINKTYKTKKNFEEYYTKDIQARARIVFGKYMKRWGYKFPDSWKKPSIRCNILVSIPLNIKYLIGYIYYILFKK